MMDEVSKAKLEDILDGPVPEKLEAVCDKILAASVRAGGQRALSTETLALLAGLKDVLPSAEEVEAKAKEIAEAQAKADQEKAKEIAEAEAERQKVLVEGQGPDAPDAQGPKVDPPAEPVPEGDAALVNENLSEVDADGNPNPPPAVDNLKSTE